MQFKIGQPMITIMNLSNIIVQHTIKIFKYPHFCSTNYTTKVYNWSVFKRQCFSLSLISAMDVHGIEKLHVL